AEKAILPPERILTQKGALKHIQTLFVKYQFYFAQGQPAAGINTLREAMQLIHYWWLDIDPDEGMFNNRLLPHEKDER
ncbi:hypothetical protein HK100_007504, partial [Physocladia obscura]